MIDRGIIMAPSGRKLAYSRNVIDFKTKDRPSFVFLGGFMSTMSGTKALHLETWATKNKYNFLRFDYSGHGDSDGEFCDGCISTWVEDAKNAIEELTRGSQVIVGSSMGGWIALLLHRVIPRKIAGFLGIAAAPDFTERKIWKDLNADARKQLLNEGKIEIDSNYSPEPYLISKLLIEDGRKNLIFEKPLEVAYPVRLLQGSLDIDVDVSLALDLLNILTGNDIRLTIVKGADHQFSNSSCLRLIEQNIDEIFSICYTV